MEYSMYYRQELSPTSDWGEWDLFLSSFNLSQRLEVVYNNVRAKEKYWLVFPEYQFEKQEYPKKEKNKHVVEIDEGNEIQQFDSMNSAVNLASYNNKSVCIDITGFMRPQLLFLLLRLKHLGFEKVDFLYSEPESYAKGEKTTFTNGAVLETRVIAGFAGVTHVMGDRDLLIIAPGYDSTLISKVTQEHENSEVAHIFGFPSLRPHMYQENILNTVAVADSFAGNSIPDPMFAPAADPFETASTIKQYIFEGNSLEKYRHIYLSPLSTKAQTLGVGLVYLNEFQGLPVSVIYPFTKGYAKETSRGIAKMWSYTVEFDQ